MHTRSTTREYYEAILVAAIFALFARTFTVQAFKIPTGSMKDNLLIGDHLLVNKFAYAPHYAWEEGWLPYREMGRGDVVVFKFPDDPRRDFIKRVIGLPGQTVQVVAKKVHIDGKAVEESYVFHKDPELRETRDNFGPWTIPPDTFFVMGDNRDDSHDARFWARPLHRDLVKGRALLIYWSYDSPEAVPVEFAGVGPKIKQLASVAIHFFSNTRWARTFRLVR